MWTKCGSDVVEKPLIVSDDEKPSLGAGEPVDSLGNSLEGVDVEARVGLVHHGQLRLQDRHLQHLVSLPLSARETLVQVAIGKARPTSQRLHRIHHLEPEFEDRQVDTGAVGERLTKKLDDGNPGDRLRILKGQEQPTTAPLIRTHGQQIVTVEKNSSAGDPVLGVSGQHIGERALAGPVRSHDGVDLAVVDRQVDSMEDLEAFGVGREPLDLKKWGSSQPPS